MSPAIETMSLNQIPEDLIAEISQSLHWYSTGLVKVYRDKGGKEKAHLVGSGTLISVGSVHGILTAQHVVALLREPCSLGLTLSPQAHKFAIEVNYLRILEIAKATISSEGPDLAFIELPLAAVSTIRANKSFYNLPKVRPRMLDSPPPDDMGIWFICGVPDEQTTIDESEKGFDYLLGFHSLCGATGISQAYIYGDYDYFELDVKYSNSEVVPKSFGGVSGGGLWQVLLLKDREGNMVMKEYFLSGVAFYQSEVREQSRFIKCHGRQSIYEVAHGRIAASCS
jgi:hypothetical protein